MTDYWTSDRKWTLAILVLGALVVVAVAYWYRVTNAWRGTDPMVMMLWGVLSLLLVGSALVYVLWYEFFRDRK